MASIRVEREIAASPEDAWDALRDWGAIHERLVWSIVDGPYTHHNGAAQVLDGGDGGTLFVWTADVLPDETAAVTGEMMEKGIETVRRTLESAGS